MKGRSILPRADSIADNPMKTARLEREFASTSDSADRSDTVTSTVGKPSERRPECKKMNNLETSVEAF